MIFPCEQSFDEVCEFSIEHGNAVEVCRLCHDEHVKFAFDRVLLIDSTWSQTKRINLDDRIMKLPHR